MPLVSAGTWQYNATEAASVVELALGAGFRHVDTAYDYGNQRGCSTGLRRGSAAAGLERGDVFVTTKVPGCGVQGVDPGDCSGSTKAFLETDFAELGSDFGLGGYIDLVLLHFPPCVTDPQPGSPTTTRCSKDRSGCSSANCAAIKDQWAVLEEFYGAKKIRAIGVSNFCDACLACLAGAAVQPAVNQVQLHVGMGSDPQGFFAMNARYGIQTQAWSPLGSGGHGSSEILSGNLTSAVARAHGKSTAQVALKYLLAKGAAVATKSSSAAHLAQDIALFDWALSDADVAALDAASFAADDVPSFMCDNTP